MPTLTNWINQSSLVNSAHRVHRMKVLTPFGFIRTITDMQARGVGSTMQEDIAVILQLNKDKE